jgi:hypothetical protein
LLDISFSTPILRVVFIPLSVIGVIVIAGSHCEKVRCTVPGRVIIFIPTVCILCKRIIININLPIIIPILFNVPISIPIVWIILIPLIVIGIPIVTYMYGFVE